MSTTKQSYGASNQPITCSLASLINTFARASTAVDNTTNLFLDALVFLKFKTGASGTSATGNVSVYAYGTADGGTSYTEGASGTDDPISLLSSTNLRLLGAYNVAANATTYSVGPVSVAAAFGGVLPQKWGIVVVNNSGGTLDATEGSHLKIYQGLWLQTV